VLPSRLTMNGRDFEQVSVRRSGVAVYRGQDEYLRIGRTLDEELSAHQAMLGHGYPVPGIVEFGQYDGATYVIEKSLGSHTLGDAFAAQLEGHGAAHVGDEQFSAFQEVIRRQAKAQLGLVTRSWDSTQFAALVGVKSAAGNVPELAEQILSAFQTAMSTLGAFPGTLLHGDLQPYNVTARGVFDLEDAGWGVVGYDVATAVFVPTLCDPTFDGQATTPAWFSRPQIHAYLSMLDDSFLAAGLPRPSRHVDALLLCRAISLCAHEHPRHEVWHQRRRMLGAVLRSFAATGTMPDGWAGTADRRQVTWDP
jgi:hypothetical protein